MEESIKKNQEKNDIEINLKEIVLSFSLYKFHIIILIFLGMLIGGVYSYNDKMMWRGTIEVKKINSLEHDKYLPLNRTLNRTFLSAADMSREFDMESEQYRESVNEYYSTYIIENDYLSTLLLEEISDRDEIVEFFDKNNIIDKDSFR